MMVTQCRDMVLPVAGVTSALSPWRTLMSRLCASRFASAHKPWTAWPAMHWPTSFLVRSASPAPSGLASTRADGGSEAPARLSAASTWAMTASWTAARTAGLAAAG